MKRFLWSRGAKAVYLMAGVALVLAAGSINFYALNVNEDSDPVAYSSEHGYEFDLLLDAGKVEDLYGTFGTPRRGVVPSGT